MIKSFLIRAAAVTALLVLMLPAGLPAAALGTDYTVATDGGEKIYLPETYSHVASVSGVKSASGGAFSTPGDVFIDENDRVYIADTGNSRVLILDREGGFLGEISAWDGDMLVNPTSVFAADGEIYITDTGNYRVAVFDKDGGYLREYAKPESELLGSLSIYMPDHIVKSSRTRYMYVIAGKQLLTIDSQNRFQGYLGAEPVAFSLKNLLIRKFGSTEQLDRLSQSEPVSYQNICLSGGDVYAVTLGKKNNIKVLNGVGNNIFPSGSYGESIVDLKEKTVAEPAFQDIAVEPDGNILAAQANNNRIYAYDTDGNMLFSFGGTGDTAGCFGSISSIACDSRGYLYVLDSAQNRLQILRPTYFAQRVYLGNTQYREGDYAAALGTWQETAALCPGYLQAHRRTGDILFKQKDFEGAAQEYLTAKDSARYAKVYDRLRGDWLKKHFALAAFGAAAAIMLLYFAVTGYKKWCRKIEHRLYFEKQGAHSAFAQLIPLVLFHPLACFDRIKANRERIPKSICLLLLLLVPAVCIFRVAAGNYAMSGKTVSDTSLFYESAVLLAPVLLWLVLSYLVTALMSGEATAGETAAAGCYSLVPWLVFTPVLTLLSHLAGSGGAVFFKGAELLLIVWVICYLLMALGSLNDYSFGKTALVTLISLFGMAVVCLAVLLFSSLCVQAYDQISKIAHEFSTLNM